MGIHGKNRKEKKNSLNVNRIHIGIGFFRLSSCYDTDLYIYIYIFVDMIPLSVNCHKFSFKSIRRISFVFTGYFR